MLADQVPMLAESASPVAGLAASVSEFALRAADLAPGIPGPARPVLVALIVGILVHVASLAVVGRVRATAAGPAADPGRYVDDRADRVRCPSCRAENDLGYRFFRECLGELPGAIDRANSPSNPFRTAG